LHKDKIRKLEQERTQQTQQAQMNMNMGHMGQMGPMGNDMGQYQMNMMNMMMMNMNQHYGNNQPGGQMNPNMQQQMMLQQQMMNPNMMQMMAAMNMNPQMLAMLPPFPNHFHNNNKNMFVRKAKNLNNEPGSAKGGREYKKNYQNYGNKGQQNYQFPSNHSNNAPANNNNLQGKQNQSPFREDANTMNSHKKRSIDSFRPRVDSENFPALPNKTIEVQVPTGPLEDMNLEDDGPFDLKNPKLTKKMIFEKFNVMKEDGKIKISKKLKGLSGDKYPILDKEGDIRIEELEPTQLKELKVIISEKPSRKGTGYSGDKSISTHNSPWRKVPAQKYVRVESEN